MPYLKLSVDILNISFILSYNVHYYKLSEFKPRTILSTISFSINESLSEFKSNSTLPFHLLLPSANLISSKVPA